MKQRISGSNILQSWLFIAGLTFLVSGCSDGSDGSDSVQRSLQTTRCIDTTAASEDHRFMCDGVEFKTMLTPECVEEACGLIIDVHGWLSNPDEQERRTGLASLAAERGGYIVVQPGEQGSPPSWDGPTHYPVIADFMQQAITAFDVDEDRVHFTGFSQGGFMTWQFICDYSDIIASAAPFSAIEVGCFRSDSGPARQVPVLFTTGTGDVLIQYYNEATSLSVPFTLLNVLYDYGMATVDADAYDYAEDGKLVVDSGSRIDVITDATEYEKIDGGETAGFLWTRYTNTAGVVFEHLRHDNGHVYPDNPDSLILPEEPTVWFSIGEAVLQFFIDNPRQ
ncbi:MAG: PHB depolymerase family esterase [Halioglobus sp.]